MVSESYTTPDVPVSLVGRMVNAISPRTDALYGPHRLGGVTNGLLVFVDESGNITHEIDEDGWVIYAADEHDAINPKHYQGVELDGVAVQCIHIIEVLDLDFHLGNALKYAWRFGAKHERLSEEIGKCRWYLDRWRSSGHERRDIEAFARSACGVDVIEAKRMSLAGMLRDLCNTLAEERRQDHGVSTVAHMVEMIDVLGIRELVIEQAKTEERKD